MEEPITIKESEQKEEEEEVMNDKYYTVTGRILGELNVESGAERLERWGEKEYVGMEAKNIPPRITQNRSNKAEARLTFDYLDPEIKVCGEPSGQEQDACMVRKRLRDEKGDEGAKKRLKTLLLPLISGEGVAAIAAESVNVDVRLDSEKVLEFWASFSIPFVDILKGVYQKLEEEEEEGDRFCFGWEGGKGKEGMK